MTCPSGGVASVAQEGLLDGYGRIGSGLMGGYQDEPLMSSADLFRGRFQVLDSATCQPITGQPVRVRSTGGQ
ncbi:hypothetical protein NLO72_12545 [Pseudomonas tremae]|nr:hypothetical protein [Pseudomonas tremae]MCQ2990053.1 hypothetical protein [Pseudomonas tremae]